jgi:hypothetical protein
MIKGSHLSLEKRKARCGINNSFFNPNIIHLSKEELERLFVNEGLTIREIYHYCGYKGPFMIQKQLRQNGISRPKGDKWSPKSKKRLSDSWKTQQRINGIRKMRRTKIRLFKEGTLSAWNKNKPGLSMERNPRWKGGVSFEPYEPAFNNKLKELVRKRDNYECQICGKKQEKLNYKLNVHHIDFNKKNNALSNLMSLCKPCHSSTTVKRKIIIKLEA